MKSKKGLYLLIALIGTILIFFFILFFVHEHTLENGILFKVSFEYEDAKEIIYNFYNQNGKIEKIEGENKFLLEKTDYNTVKLLRKITKKVKETKTPTKEKGITIYNGQNKRYYLLSYESDGAKELADYIVDGYIHYELSKNTDKTFGPEIYFYKTEKELGWTKDGSKANIIHTYRCEKEDCKILYTEKDLFESVLWDKEYYLYNYLSKTKEKINVEDSIISAHFVKLNNHIMGLELINNQNQKAYYDLKSKSLKTEYEKDSHTLVNETLMLNQKKQKENIKLTVWNIDIREILWKKELPPEENVSYSLSIVNSEKNYYLLGKEKEGKITYQLLDHEGNTLLDNKNVELTEQNELLVIDENAEKPYKYYSTDGIFLRELEELPKE